MSKIDCAFAVGRVDVAWSNLEAHFRQYPLFGFSDRWLNATAQPTGTSSVLDPPIVHGSIVLGRFMSWISVAELL